MSAIKRIPVTESVWKDLSEMRTAGLTYTDLLYEMIDERNKLLLARDMKKIEKEGTFVSHSDIEH